jgi:hypothetical protein
MRLTKAFQRVSSCLDRTSLVEAFVVKLHFVENSSIAQRFLCESDAKVFDVPLQQSLVGALQLVDSSCAVVQKTSIEVHAQALSGQPGGDSGMLNTPEELCRWRDAGVHCATVSMFMVDD